LYTNFHPLKTRKDPISLQEAQARLPELIAELMPGEELRLLHEGRTIATLVKTWVPSPTPRQAGSAKDIPHFMADDFDAPLEDFKEYMP
jgi:antitoxin (DNA-binding transcriptional repressor) of toxin-antitoxin stability system